MKLLVDIGNSRVKWGTETAGEIQGPFAFAIHGAPAAKAFEAAWGRLDPAAVRYCSVAATGLPSALEQWIRDRWALEPRRLQSIASAGGVVNGYRDPVTLGADRWANLLGARALLGAHDAVVVDAGTAVTVDALRADGHHLGGAILSGLQAARDGLAAAAPALPAAGGDPGLPADSTAGALAGGSLLGLAGAIERVAQAVGHSLAQPAWLITGGDTDTLRPWLDPCWRREPGLTLHGLSAAGED